MIVRNEGATITRCLQAVRDHIDYWVIVDTGSTDDTKARIRDLLAGIPGELHERAWVDFGHNRTEALRLAEGKADYLLLCDADMQLVVRDREWKAKLSGEGYLIRQVSNSSFSYLNVRLINARQSGPRQWRYWGSTHEYCGLADPKLSAATTAFDGIEFIDHADGGTRTEKFARDSAMLERDLSELERLNRAAECAPLDAERQDRLEILRMLETRNLFYLAQTYRDMGRLEDSLATYRRRASIDPLAEESWVALYEAAKLVEKLGRDEAEIVYGYLRVFESRPTRSDPLVELARYFRNLGRHQLAHLFAKRALDIPMPDNDRLFVETSFYTWRARDEYAVACYWVGDWAESLNTCKQLLEGGALPPDQVERVKQNMAFAVDKLSG
jgi:glycosyltransferase involved in cell wall biosynthesis